MAKPTDPAEVKIRRAKNGDAARLAVLSGELGYPATTAEIKIRLRRILPRKEDLVLVAERNGEVIGWMHMSVCDFVEMPIFAEINGLIVAEGQRSGGAGAKLLEAGEVWARKKKCVMMHLRSNVVRERAHAFYLRQGFEHFKTSKVFRKFL
jgi:N-acetylglutamate synthase-like GNAT family acetyltransferase